MYYIIIPLETCQKRKVFLSNMRTEDGRVVISLRELGLIRFSLGAVEIVNDKDLPPLVPAAEANGAAEGTDETPQQEETQPAEPAAASTEAEAGADANTENATDAEAEVAADAGANADTETNAETADNAETAGTTETADSEGEDGGKEGAA